MFSLFIGVWVARYLGPERYGALSFAVAFITFFSVVSTLGLRDVVVRDIVESESDRVTTLCSAGAMQLFAGIVMWIACLYVGSIVKPDDHLVRGLVLILCTNILFKFSDVVIYWFESQVETKRVVRVRNSALIVTGITKVILILNQASLTAFAFATLAEGLFISLMLFVTLRLWGPTFANGSISIKKIKYLLECSWPLMLTALATTIYMKIDQVMIGKLLTNTDVGIYSAAVRVTNAMYFFPMIITESVFPAILNAKKRNEEEYYQRFQKLFDYLTWITITSAIAITVLSPIIMITLFGEQYALSSEILAIHAWALVFVCLGNISRKWFIAERKPVLELQRTLLGVAANVTLNLWLIPTHGGVGAAIATVISLTLVAFFSDLLQKETRHLFKMKLRSLNLWGVINRLRLAL